MITNPKIKMHQNKSKFIKDHLKKLLSYSSLQEVDPLIQDFKIMQEIITKIWLQKPMILFQRFKNNK